MSSATALYPLWAIALTVAFTALRLGGSPRRGLIWLSACLALWVAGLIAALSPLAAGWAGRLVPSGMLLAGGFTHAFADVAQLHDARSRRVVKAMWAFGAVVAGLGVLAPQTLYLHQSNGIGVLFWPLAALASVLTIATLRWMLMHTLRASGPIRRRSAAVLGANVLGAVGGGGIIVLQVLNLAPIVAGAPALLGSILLVSWSVLSQESGRRFDLLWQGLWYGVVAAGFLAVVMACLVQVLPSLAVRNWVELVWVAFMVALPLEPLRALIVERLGLRFLRRPTAVSSLANELETAERRAMHAEQLAELGQLASVVAHEVRNPLGVILAQAKLLEKEGADTSRVQDVRAQVARANGFVDELLRYAKPRPLRLVPVNLAEAARTAVTQVEKAQSAHVFHSEVDSGLSIEADQQAVIDSLVIVLANAAIAVEALEQGRVVIRCVPATHEVSLIVEDNGAGVAVELAPKLFELFVTGRGRDHAHPGIGLGLAIARQHLRRHGGSIHHEPNSPNGARFILRWPRRAAAFSDPGLNVSESGP